MTNEAYLRGVGGWLGLLIIVLCILSPLSMIGRTVGDIATVEKAMPALAHMTEWAYYKQYTYCLIALCASLSFVAGYRLWKTHYPESVRFAIATLWIVNLLNILGQYVITTIAFGEQVAEKLVPGLIVTAMMAAI
ncbi:MAG TPA: DUF2569 family protein, partial [Gammaproteobacteria bacterium]|nr:DUF2569 family protein [Gammaproteobacteria bacterium]